MAFDPVSGQGRDLAGNVDLISQTEASAGRLLFFTTTDDATEIRLVDVGSGDVEDFSKGDWPVSSGTRVAFCPSPGNLVVADARDAARRETVGRVSPGCAAMAWRDGRLAFLQALPSATEGGTTVSLWRDGTLDAFDAPVPVQGYGDVTWSVKATSLLYSNAHGYIVDIDLADRNARMAGRGYDPRYSPVDDDLYAAMTVWRDAPAESVEVRGRDGHVVAAHKLPQGTPPGVSAFAWSPDGSTLAIVSPACIDLWVWKTDASSCIAKPASGAFLPVALWFK